MAKINLTSSLSIAEAFESFLFSKSAQGVLPLQGRKDNRKEIYNDNSMVNLFLLI